MSDSNNSISPKNQLDAMLKFPDQNPNPVLRMSVSKELLFSNEAGRALTNVWGTGLGEILPPQIVEHDRSSTGSSLELGVGSKTYSFQIVDVPEFEFINIYCTDVTAIKAIHKFPDQNPNPVLKIGFDGRLLYVNEAGQHVQKTLGLEIGENVPGAFGQFTKLTPDEPLELSVGDRVYVFHRVPVPEFDFLIVYGTDVTVAKDNEQILIKLAKYFSPQVYESIFAGDLEVKIQTKRKRLTVFFSDIKSFSEITERLEPEILTELITDYLTEMTHIAVKHGGTVDKYIGDTIMVFFGDPKSKGHKEDAIACVKMAMEMKSSMHGIRRMWKEKGIPQPLDIRIGIHTDTCTVGNFGSSDRLDYTTIGNGVNLASRLESNARTNQILISEDTFLLIRDSIRCEKLDKISVKNMKRPIQTYEVHDSLDLVSREDQLKVQAAGFSLIIDSEKIDNLAQKREILEKALNLLNRLD